MKDLSSLSDDQIDAMVAEKLALRIPSPPKTDYASMSDAEIDEMVMQKMEQSQAQDRPAQAALAGFGQAASFGYLPQLQAATEKGVDFLFGDDTDEQLKAQGFTVPAEPTYTESRDQFIKERQSLEQSNPKSSIAGAVGGSIASGIATGGLFGAGAKAGQGVTTVARLKTAAKTGAAIGAVRNPGDTEGEIDPVQFLDRVKNASMDAATGLILQGGMETVGKAAKALKNSPGTLKNWSQVKAFKTSGAMLKDFRKAFGRKKVNEIGQTMIDNKLVALGDDVADIAKKSEIMKADVGNKIGSIYESADDAITKINPSKLSPDILKRLDDTEPDMRRFATEFRAYIYNEFQGKAGSKGVLARIDDELETIATNGSVSLGKLKEIRQSVDALVDFSKEAKDLPGTQQALTDMRNKLNELAKNRLGVIDDINGTKLLRDLNKSNREFSNLAEITKIAKDRVARDSTNAAFGLRERISGGAGAVVGGMIGGVPGAVAGGVIGSVTTKVAKEFGTPFVAIASNRAARALENNKELLGKFADPLIKGATSPKEFVATVNLLMRDPEFKKKIESINPGALNGRGLANGEQLKRSK